MSVSRQTLGRELRAMGFRKLSARPRHYAQDAEAIENFKKNVPAELATVQQRIGAGVEIEIWFQDETRIGQKNKLTRQWGSERLSQATFAGAKALRATSAHSARYASEGAP